MNDREHAAMMLTLAKHDLSALECMQDSVSFTTAIFGFHAQQAAEKFFKAFWVEHQIEFRKTHGWSL